MLRLEMTPDKVKWVLFNPAEREVEFAGQTTRKAYEYRR